MKVGAIPLYRGQGGLRVCLVSTSSSRKRFTFPKGVVKRRESWERGALRELSEEAGATGRILMPRHPLVLADEKRPSESVVLYWCEILTIDDAWKEDDLRRRIFCSVNRMPRVKLGRTGKEVFKEIVELGLDGDPRDDSGQLGVVERIRARLLGLRLRTEIDTVTRI